MRRINMSRLLDLTIKFLLIVGFASFEVFNIYTTRLGLNMIMQNAFAATVFAVAIACTDLGGLSRVFLGRHKNHVDDQIVSWVVMGVWALVAMMNAFLTWWTIETGFETKPPVGPAEMVGNTSYLAVFISILVFLVHIAMIYGISVYLQAHLPQNTNVYTQRQQQHAQQNQHRISTHRPVFAGVENDDDLTN